MRKGEAASSIASRVKYAAVAGVSAVNGVRSAHENGHYYSPVVDPCQLEPTRLWPEQPEVLGIDFDDNGHERLLRDVLRPHLTAYDYPELLDEAPEVTQYFTGNSQYGWLDSRSLFAFLREWKPRRLIEVGSGFSTLLTADVNVRFLKGGMDVTCIEPYPRAFLRRGIPGVSRLMEAKVQDVPLSEFAALEAGDILFIDSSHVAKTGSDVNYLYFEVLPRLAAGVRVHVHDIFLPHEYPHDWVIRDNRSWNEQYLLRALLMHSSHFRVVFGCTYAFWRFPELVREAIAHADGHEFGGGSFWIERI
jgi:hypothetical protein